MTRPTFIILLRVLLEAGTCLPSRCLAPKGGILVQLTEPLPWNDRKDTHTDTQIDGMDLLSTPLRWVRVPYYTVHTKFHKDWFRHSKVDKGDTQTRRQDGDRINLL
jgi:hypothetical protein